MGGKEGPLMTEIHICLFSFSLPNSSDKEWQLCTTEGPTPVFKCCVWGGGREGPLMAEIYIASLQNVMYKINVLKCTVGRAYIFAHSSLFDRHSRPRLGHGLA